MVLMTAGFLFLFAANQTGSAASQTVASAIGRASVAGARSVFRDLSGTFEIERIASGPKMRQGRSWAWMRDHRRKRAWKVLIDSHAIVQVPPGQSVDTLFSSLGLRPVEALMPSIGLWRVADASGKRDGAQLAEALLPAVEQGVLQQATPDFHVERQLEDISLPPNDPGYGGQWYLASMNIEAAWALSDGDPSTTVVVIDNGCDGQHPDLVDNFAPGLDVIDDDDDPNHQPGVDGNEHGTACVGIVAARGDNGTGIVGVCPECTVRCVRLLGAQTPISADVRALRFALEVDAAVVSNSWSYVDGLPAPGPVAAAIAELQQDGREGRGTVVVFAAGNENRNLEPGEISALPGVITVGAVNNFDEATAFTNRGPSLDFSAPAATFTTDIVGADGADPGDYTDSFGGTSAACPVAAGVAALLASADPTASAQEIRTAMLDGLRPAPFAQPGPDGHDEQYGRGIIDPEAALRRLLDLPVASTDAGVASPDAEVGGFDAGVAAPDGPSTSSGCRGTSELAIDWRSPPWIGVVTAAFLFVRTRGRRKVGGHHG